MSDSTLQALSGFVPLATQVVGARIFVLDDVDSTNDLALAEGGDGVVYVADRQRSGRGRHGRVWHSAAGRGLWFSVAFEGPAEGLVFAAPLAVRDALRPLCRLTVKWPNDLLLNGKKVCGILLEHRMGRTAVGIGLNVLHGPDDFPDELRDTATSLAMELGPTWDRARLLAAILLELDRRVLALRAGAYEAIRREWADACDLVGRCVRSGSVEGWVADIDHAGALILELAQGAHRVVSGDITVVTGV